MAFWKVLRINDDIVFLYLCILLAVKIYEEHEEGKEEPDEHAGCAEVTACWLRNALGYRGTFVLQCFLQFTHRLLGVILRVSDVSLEFVQGLTLLLYKFIQVLEYLVNVCYALGHVGDLLGSLIHAVLKLRYLL